MAARNGHRDPILQALASLQKEMAGLRQQHEVETGALRSQIASLRDDIGRWDRVVTKLREYHIAELLTRDDLKDHPFYAFRNLVLHRVLHTIEGNAKLSTGPDGEFLIYGSSLSFIETKLTHPTSRKSVDGLRLGLEHGVKFRLSLLSPLPDVRDTSEMRLRREEASSTLDYMLHIKEEAKAHPHWEGGFMLSATPYIVNDSFSSIKVGCDRLVSVLAASKHKRVTEYVFDESPVDQQSVASELRSIYGRAYEQETFPLLMHNWEDLPASLLSVRVVVFVDRDRIAVDRASSAEPWISWEFDWEDATTIEQILTYKLEHLVDAPDHLTGAGLVDIVYAGRSRGREGKQHVVFIARKSRSNLSNAAGSAEYDAVRRTIPADISLTIERYRSALT